MRRYFLGGLPQEERDHLEDRYLTDQEVFEELVATENDLIDAYVRGELSGEERQSFVLAYSSTPDRRERVEFARALNHASALARQSAQIQRVSLWKSAWAFISIQQAIPRWALVGAALVVVVPGSWLLEQNRSLQASLC
jgi:hypothetical protein